MRCTPVTLTLVLCVAAAAPAWARNFYIDMPDGQVILGDAKCRNGGQEATFIASRGNAPGMFGCWEAKDSYVYVHWTTAMGANGSQLRMNNIQRYAAPQAMLAAVPTSEDKAIIDRADRLNSLCRGGGGSEAKTLEACGQRDALMSQITKRGWCWGPDSAIGAERRWIRCSENR